MTVPTASATELNPVGVDTVRPRRSLEFGRAGRLAMLSSVAVGVLVAHAPVLPGAVRSQMLVIGLVAWTVAVAAGTAAGSTAIWQRVRARDQRVVLLLASVGIGVALVAAVQVELIQTLLGRPGFTWSWRWDLNHAQAIARFGGLAQALDYSGASIHYHVGPAWFAGAVQRVMGAGLTHVMFGLVPLLCVVTLTIAIVTTLGNGGMRLRYAALGTAMALTVPLADKTAWGVYYVLPGALANPESWPFLATMLMHNSLFGLAVGMGCLALLMERRAQPVQLAFAALGLASLSQIKPQYYAGFGLLAGVLALGRMIGRQPFGPRDARPIIATALSLPLALIQMALLPGDVAWFKLPEWKPSLERGLFYEPLRASSYLAVLAVLAWHARHRRADPGMPARIIEPVLAAATALIVMAGVLHFVNFPFREEFVSRWFALGFRDLTEAVAGNKDLGQALQVPRFMLLAAGLGVVATAAAQTGGLWPKAFAVSAGLTVAAPTPLLVSSFWHPPTQLAVADDVGLRHTLAQIPQRGTLLIASDLADPAQDYSRPLQAMLLTAYGGHSLYVANLRYIHYVEPDALNRLQELRSFFGAPWSPWHTAWLASRRITHVLVDDRCTPVWSAQPGLPLRLVTRRGRWTAFEVVGAEVPSPPTATPTADGPSPAYGVADCLSGKQLSRAGSIARPAVPTAPLGQGEPGSF